MQYSFTLSLSTLRAALTHAADADVRYYLNGIYIDLPRGRIVATDGHRMLIANGPYVLGAPAVIVGRDTVAAVIKAYESAGPVFKQGGTMGECGIECAVNEIDARPDPERPGVTISAKVDSVSFKVPHGAVTAAPIDGKYPEYLRVIPTTVSGQAGHYQAEYILEATQAFRAHRNRKKNDSKYNPALIQNGLGPAVMVDGDNDILIIIMPLRADVVPERATEACAWARSDAPAAAAAAAAG